MEHYPTDVIPYGQVEQRNAQWTHDQEQLFIELMVDVVVAKGNKNKGSVRFAKDEWTDICKELYYRTGKKYETKQLKIS